VGFNIPHQLKTNDMSKGINYLHSHSGIEKELKMPKHLVLVDEKYEDFLLGGSLNGQVNFRRVKYNGKVYLEVPIMMFVKNGGVFKNLNA